MAGKTPFAPIGAEMKLRRESAKLTVTRLAELVSVRPATISRWENGERTPQAEDVTKYLEAVGTPKQQIDDLLTLAEETGILIRPNGGFFSQARQLAELLEADRTASHISIVSPMLVPGLLQIGPYVRAMLRDDAAVPEGEIDRRVAVRLGRKEAITRKNPTRLLAVIGETVLCQNIGGPEVMAEQLRSLLQAMEMPNVELRVSPHNAGWNPSLDGFFAVVRFEDRDPVVRTESHKTSMVYKDPTDLEMYCALLDQVLDVALSPESSRDLIASYIEKWE